METPLAFLKKFLSLFWKVSINDGYRLLFYGKTRCSIPLDVIHPLPFSYETNFHLLEA